MPKTIKLLDRVALTDGIALLLLFFIAVPVKYMADFPLLVKILGPTHGALFILLVVLLIINLSKKYIPLWLAALLFFGALLPGGAFFADYKLRKHISSTDND